LRIEAGTPVVVLDDDPSVHRIWKERLEGLKVFHFSTVSQFTAWMGSRDLRADGALFLVDHEIRGGSTTGLDLIRAHGIAARSILVTSHYADPRIRVQCEALGVRLVPKGMAGFVPLARIRDSARLDVSLPV
jgi:hypothetical protein